MTEFNLRAIVTEYARLLEHEEPPSPRTLYEIYANRPAKEKRLMPFQRLVALVRKVDRTAFAALSLDEKERYLISAYFSQ